MNAKNVDRSRILSNNRLKQVRRICQGVVSEISHFLKYFCVLAQFPLSLPFVADAFCQFLFSGDYQSLSVFPHRLHPILHALITVSTTASAPL